MDFSHGYNVKQQKDTHSKEMLLLLILSPKENCKRNRKEVESNKTKNFLISFFLK